MASLLNAARKFRDVDPSIKFRGLDIAVGAGGGNIGALILADEPSVYWPLEEDTLDASGNGFDATTQDDLLFTEDGAYLNSAYSYAYAALTGLAGVSTYSIEGVVTQVDESGSNGTFKYLFGLVTATGSSIATVFLRNDLNVLCELSQFSGSDYGIDWEVGTKAHVAFTTDGTTDRFYINGVEIWSKAFSDAFSAELSIGRSSGHALRRAAVKHVAVYHGVELTPAQISDRAKEI